MDGWQPPQLADVFFGGVEGVYGPQRLSPIHSTRRRGAQGLMWGARGPFPPAAAMAGYGCDGWCWLLEAYVRSINCRNSRHCLRKYFFFSYVDPIHSWHLTRQLKKKDLDLRTLLFSWFLCPVFYGIYFNQFLLALPAITYLQKRYERKVKLVMFVTLSLLASF